MSGTLTGEVVINGVTYKIETTITPQGQPPPPPPPQKQELKIVQVKASGDDGNVAENVLDANPSRWSCDQVPCTLDAYLGCKPEEHQEVSQVKIQFFRGNERTANFDLAYSEDGQNFETIMSGRQEGGMTVTVDIEPSVHPMIFRYVGRGNNINNWTSIEHLQLFGKQLVDVTGPCPGGPPTPPSPPPGPPSPPTPPPGGEEGSTTKDGVTVPFKIKGQWSYDVDKNERDGGARYNMDGAGTSFVMVGYFRSSGGSDDVAMKMLGGRHTNSAEYDGCCYDPAVAVDSGRPRLRCECPHPDYTDNLDLDFEQQGMGIRNRWVGFMAVALQEQGGVRIQVHQDQGNNDNSPANKWVKILEFFDDGTKVRGIEGEDRYPLRELPGSAQNTFRIDETPGLQEKWLGIAEIDLA